MLKIYGRATSSNVQLVMWAVGELSLKHERLDYGHSFGGLDAPEYLALNPHGKIPTLVDGGTAIWESAAILRYLAARYGDGGAFWPSDASARAQVDMWAEWGKSTLSAAFTMPIFWQLVLTAAKDRDEEAIAKAIEHFNDLLETLAPPLSKHPFVTGAQFTAADIAIGSLLYRWFAIDVPRRPFPALEAYYERLTERPAYREHVMVDYSPLRVLGA